MDGEQLFTIKLKNVKNDFYTFYLDRIQILNCNLFTTMIDQFGPEIELQRKFENPEIIEEFLKCNEYNFFNRSNDFQINRCNIYELSNYNNTKLMKLFKKYFVYSEQIQFNDKLNSLNYLKICDANRFLQDFEYIGFDKFRQLYKLFFWNYNILRDSKYYESIHYYCTNCVKNKNMIRELKYEADVFDHDPVKPLINIYKERRIKTITVDFIFSYSHCNNNLYKEHKDKRMIYDFIKKINKKENTIHPYLRNNDELAIIDYNMEIYKRYGFKFFSRYNSEPRDIRYSLHVVKCGESSIEKFIKEGRRVQCMNYNLVKEKYKDYVYKENVLIPVGFISYATMYNQILYKDKTIKNNVKENIDNSTLQDYLTNYMISDIGEN